MAGYDAYTENLADFRYSEIRDAIKLLQTMVDDGLPDDFYDNDVKLAFNRNSGDVFLTNSEYEVAMINPNTGKLESWYYTPYAGHEGFLDELVEWYKDDPNDWDEEDIEYLRDLGADI